MTNFPKTLEDELLLNEYPTASVCIEDESESPLVYLEEGGASPCVSAEATNYYKTLICLSVEELESKHEEYLLKKERLGDVAYWAKLPLWNTQEAAAISIGKEPRYLDSDCIDKRLASREVIGSKANPPTFLIDFQKRKHMLEYQVKAGNLELEDSPKAFLHWFKLFEFTFPAKIEVEVLGALPTEAIYQKKYLELREKFQELEQKFLECQKQCEAASSGINPKSLNTYYSLILGMAKTKYKYGGTLSNTQVSGKISEDLLMKSNINISERTVRDTLKKADEVVEPSNL